MNEEDYNFLIKVKELCNELKFYYYRKRISIHNNITVFKMIYVSEELFKMLNKKKVPYFITKQYLCIYDLNEYF